MAAAWWLGWMASAFAMSGMAVWWLARAAGPLGLIDEPNHRSLHASPAPRGGGLGFVVVFALLLWPASRMLGIELPALLWRLLLAGFLIALVGLADDCCGMPATVRLAAQVSAATLVASPWIASVIADSSLRPRLSDAAPHAIAIIAIVAMTNFYNFMDGSDGLAAGQAVLTLTVVGVMAFSRGDRELALSAGLLAASVAGFLIHNWCPARIFMGDAGSTFLGFLFGALAASAVFEPGRASVPVGIWLFVLAPFLADTTLTLARRVWRGERWYQAHREHFYQRLIRAGWSHGRVAGLYLSVSGVLGLAAAVHVALSGWGRELLAAFLLVLPAAFGLGWNRFPGRNRAAGRT